MTTKELIKKLQALDPEGSREVCVDDDFYVDGGESVSLQIEGDTLVIVINNEKVKKGDR